MLRLAVPSDGALHEETLRLLTACGLDVHRSNQRRYTAEMPSLPGVTVHFQRSADIGLEVEEGTADLGVTGYDKYLETRREGGEAAVIIEGLDFGHSKLVLGVPDSWIDVESVSDLAELAMEFREEGRDLQVATKYPRSVGRFLLRSGVNYFSLVPSSGTLEVAPTMGYADIIADITSSGTTLRENRLKTIQGGVIMSSEACLVANRRQVASSEEKLQLATALLERIEARLEAKDLYSVTANLRGETAEGVASLVLDHGDISGLRGPTISKVHTLEGDGWFAVTVLVERAKMMEAVKRFREIGASSVTVSQPDYVFRSRSKAVARLADGG